MPLLRRKLKDSDSRSSSSSVSNSAPRALFELFTENKQSSTPKKLGTITSFKRGAKLGSGMFGTVFTALASTGEIVAVKKVRLPDKGSNSKKENAHLKMLQREVSILKQLHHRNVVQWRGCLPSSSGTYLCIFMEYVAGSSLDCVYKTYGPLKEEIVRDYTRQIVKALAYCHSKGVLHRDIKGKNILLDKTGTIKLADFGASKIKETFEEQLTPTRTYTYTALWLAPEVPHGSYDEKVDVWSTGCTVIEMMTARLPWSEMKFTQPMQVIAMLSQLQPGTKHSHPALPTNMSKDGQDFLRQCFVFDPKKRPSAEALLEHPWLQVSRND